MQLEAKITYKPLVEAFDVLQKDALKEVRTSLLRGAKVVSNYAKKHHKFKTKSGTLEKRIQERMSKDKKLAAEVFINEGDKGYGKYVHEGTKPHVIKPKSKKALYFVKGGNKNFAKVINHPGIKGEPFLDNALQAQEEKVMKIINDGIDKAIQEAGL